jgi:hypothetical protein
MNAMGTPVTCWAHRAVVTMFTALTLLGATTARAEFGSEGFELEDLSAMPLRDAELSVGTRGVALGLFDVVQLGTKCPIALLGAPKASVKVALLQTDLFALGVEVGMVWFDGDTLGFDENFSVSASPLSLRASGHVLEDLQVHGSVDVLVTDIDGNSPDVVKRLARHFFRSSELSVSFAAEYRFGRHVGVITEVEVPFLLAPARLRYTDEDGVPDFFRAIAGVHLVFGDLNLRVGAGYGPSFLGRSQLFPVLDVALRIP